jgi:hypothetical protein
LGLSRLAENVQVSSHSYSYCATLNIGTEQVADLFRHGFTLLGETLLLRRMQHVQLAHDRALGAEIPVFAAGLPAKLQPLGVARAQWSATDLVVALRPM